MAILKKNQYQFSSENEATILPSFVAPKPIFKENTPVSSAVIKIPLQPKTHKPKTVFAEPVIDNHSAPVVPAERPPSSLSSLSPVAPDSESAYLAAELSTPTPAIDEAYFRELESQTQADLAKKKAAFDHELAQQKTRVEQELEAYRQKMMQDAVSKKQAILDAAYEEGLARGQRESRSEYQHKAEDLMNAISGLAEEKLKLFREARPEILKLSLAIAHQLVKSEISLNQAVTMNIVSEAIEKVTDNTKVIIRVHRADVEFLKLNQDRIAQQLGDVKSLVIQEDSRIETGGCIIETNLGYIDATVQTKFEAIQQAIMATMEEENTAPKPSPKSAAASPPMLATTESSSTRATDDADEDEEPETHAEIDIPGTYEDDDDYDNDEDDIHTTVDDDDDFNWDDEE